MIKSNLFKVVCVSLVVAGTLSSESAHAFGKKRSTEPTTPTATPTPAPPVSHTPTPTPVPPTSGTVTPPSDTAFLKTVYDQFISVFENSSLELDYAYIEAEGDGRGYTAGRAGFTSRDGDMLWVVQNYLKVNPSSAFTQVLSTLTSDANRNSGSTSGLSSLPSIWRSAAQDPAFRHSQDVISDQQYYLPAVARAVKYNIQSPIGILCLYDASIEHGVDGDDGVDDMISRMSARSAYATEAAWITAFNKVRRATLLNPKDSSTRAVWSDSVGRVDTLQAIVNSGNYNLVTPITINPFGDEFVVTGTN